MKSRRSKENPPVLICQECRRPTPVNWYHVPGGLKAMMDRLVCADGGNPDPTSTHGKKAAEAKALELKGWPYPRHLAGRHFGLIVHGDSVGAESARRMLSDWLTDMHLISAGQGAGPCCQTRPQRSVRGPGTELSDPDPK